MMLFILVQSLLSQMDTLFFKEHQLCPNYLPPLSTRSYLKEEFAPMTSPFCKILVYWKAKELSPLKPWSQKLGVGRKSVKCINAFKSNYLMVLVNEMKNNTHQFCSLIYLLHSLLYVSPSTMQWVLCHVNEQNTYSVHMVLRYSIVGHNINIQFI